jgi:protein-tyrosine phosphatase
MSLALLPLNLPGSIYASPMPFSGTCDPFHRLLDEYGYHAIQTVVMLISEAESIDNSGINVRKLYLEKGLDVIHLPIVDYSTPDESALNAAVEQALAEAQAGKNLAIHCHYGKGRTGMFAACLARRALGLGGQEALDWVRSHLRGAVETPEQEEVVRAFLDE